jgi:hypothetical protein
MPRWFPRLQIATACFSCVPPDLNFLDPYFIFMYMHYNHCHRAKVHLQLHILLLLLILLLYSCVRRLYTLSHACMRDSLCVLLLSTFFFKFCSLLFSCCINPLMTKNVYVTQGFSPYRAANTLHFMIFTFSPCMLSHSLY